MGIFFPILVFWVFSANSLVAETVVSSFEELNAELNSSFDADVVLELNGVKTSVSGNVDVKNGQNVTISNIEDWKNSDHTNDNRLRLMINNGNLTLDNVNIKNNNLLLSSGGLGGGAVLFNKGVVEGIYNSDISNNNVGSIPYNDLWGGIISNVDGGVVNVIKDTVFSNNTFSTSQSAPHGGIIFNSASDTNKITTIKLIDNVVFQNNSMIAQANYKGGAHGTAIDNNIYGVIEKITNSKFINNKSYKPGDKAPEGHSSGGAIDNYYIIGEISHTLFSGNNVETVSQVTPAMGGAIKNIKSISDSRVLGRIDKVYDVDFIGNSAKSQYGLALGGAYAGNDGGDGQGAIVNFDDSVTFSNNYAISGENAAQGGAIYNKKGEVGIKNVSFTNNWVMGETDKTDGGAIWSDGLLDFQGKTYFVGNYKIVNGTKYNNDIYNAGTINLKEGAFVDITGGISGSGGVINIGKGASLNINDTVVSGNDIFMNDKSKLILSINGFEGINSAQSGGRVFGDINLGGTNILEINTDIIWDDVNGMVEYQFADSVDNTNGNWEVNISENGLYNINANFNDDNNIVLVEATQKSNQEIANNLGLTKNEVNQLLEITSGKGNNEIFDDIRLDLNKSAQDMRGDVRETLDDIVDKPKINVEVLREQTDIVAKSVSNRAIVRKNNAFRKLSYNDKYDVRRNVWVDTSYNSFKNKARYGFSVDSNAFIAGYDALPTSDLMTGIGYAYINSVVDDNNRHIEIDTHSLFAYGEYTKDDVFYRLFAMYGFADNEQDKIVLNNKITGNYDNELFSLYLLSGLNIEKQFYNHKLLLRPMVGVRYYHINQGKYADIAGIMYDGVKSDIWSAVVGIEMIDNLVVNGYNISQHGYINALFDIYNDGDRMHMSLPNGGGFSIMQKKSNDLGLEFGYGANVEVSKDVSLGVNYGLNVRDEYTSHSGMLGIIYGF